MVLACPELQCLEDNNVYQFGFGLNYSGRMVDERTDKYNFLYSFEHLWSSDISKLEDYYGLPYVKQSVLSQKVLDYIAENTVLL